MSASKGTTSVSPAIPRGVHAPARPGDKRSPCPMVNCLANHGYIARNGRNISAHELNTAMNEVGLSAALAAFLVRPIYNHRQDATTAQEQKQSGFLQRLWDVIWDPWSLFSKFGMRNWDQKNAAGIPVLDLDQLAQPGIVEHDISLTRRDYAQPEGNSAIVPGLVRALLKCSRDCKTLTMRDLADFRKYRIRQQLEDNTFLVYGLEQHRVACAEMALVLDVFGDGNSVPVNYVEAFFQEERLPVKEGWTKRRWWTLGIFELAMTASKIQMLIQTKFCLELCSC